MRPRIRDWFYMLLLGAAFGLLFSCASGYQAERPRPGDANTKVVAVVWPSVHTQPLTWDAWVRSPWYRQQDMVTPSRVVIAVDRSACIMPDDDVYEPRATEAYKCREPWRHARMR